MRKIVGFIMLASSLLFACNYQTVPVQFPDGFRLRARVADTQEKTEKGLMFVKHLPEDEGMLFVFDQEAERFFWMKNTFIDLDIFFLSPEGTINQIFDHVPHTYTYTPTADIPVVSAQAQYVLETPAGTARRHQLKAGDKLLFPLL
ncbi:MAG: DUF192 domain-containing protein [Elusimicrobiaceae bacterium]|nr:DUF192 domain-containing protein [Elusimicrobiaceae bacterium]